MNHLFHGRRPVASRTRDLLVARTGLTVSLLGDAVTTIALLLAVATRGPGAVAAVLVVAAAPFVVLGSWAGRLVDRHDSRVLTVLTSAVGAAGLAAMAVVSREGAPLVVLLAVFAVVQCAAAVSAPTWSALMPRIVGEQRAAAAAGTSQTLRYAAGLVGPALGGALVATLGAAGAFGVDAATFGVLATASAGITTRRSPTTAHRAARATGGMRLFAAEAVLGPLLVVLSAFVVVGTAVNVAEVLLVTRVLGGGPVAFGLTGAVGSAGLVVGSLLARRARTDRRRVVGTTGAAVVMGALMVAEGITPSLAVLFVLLASNGVANGVLSGCFGQVLVTRTRDAERGRVAAAVSGVTEAAGVLGLPLGALLTVALGPRGAFVAGGVLAVGVTALTVAATGRRLARAVVPPRAVLPPDTGNGHGHR